MPGMSWCSHLVDEEFDAAQTQIVAKVKEVMQGQTRDEVGATIETEKSSSSAGSSSESFEGSTGCSDAGKGEVKYWEIDRRIVK